MKTIIYKLLPTKKIISKLDDKKGVNIPWNSRLFFQVGLIISLLLVYLVIESTSEMTVSNVEVIPDYSLDEDPTFTIKLEEPKKIVPKKLKNKSLNLKKKL